MTLLKKKKKKKKKVHSSHGSRRKPNIWSQFSNLFFFTALRHIFVFVPTAATGDMPAYQLRSPNSSLAQSIVMAASPGAMSSPSSQHAEEITRKREVRLMKNR